MTLHIEAILAFRQMVQDEDFWTMIQGLLIAEIKDGIISAKTPEEAYEVKLRIDAAHNLFRVIEDSVKPAEGEDDGNGNESDHA